MVDCLNVTVAVASSYTHELFCYTLVRRIVKVSLVVLNHETTDVLNLINDQVFSNVINDQVFSKVNNNQVFSTLINE